MTDRWLIAFVVRAETEADVAQALEQAGLSMGAHVVVRRSMRQRLDHDRVPVDLDTPPR